MNCNEQKQLSLLLSIKCYKDVLLRELSFAKREMLQMIFITEDIDGTMFTLCIWSSNRFDVVNIFVVFELVILLERWPMDTHPIRQGNRTPNKETNPVVYIYENRGVTGEIVDNGR